MSARTYVKKPVEVQAVQWHRLGDHPAVTAFHHPDLPGEGECARCGHVWDEHGWIDTLEGGHIVCVGDYVITGVQGEHYPCKPDIFAATYDRKPMLDTIVSWSGRRHYRAPGQREALCGNYGSAPNGDGQVTQGHKEGRQASTLPLCGSCKKSAETRGLL